VTKREKSPVNDALWKGALAIVADLPRETGGGYRGVGEFSRDGDASTVKTTLGVEQPDGTTKVYRITLTVAESTDDHDGLWGPRGRADVADDNKPGMRVVIDANLYTIGDGHSSHGFQGFGGREFHIEFFDGRTVTTRDLWHHGVVPPKWRERWPDNAKFVTPNATDGSTA
jgi:hypothetical protein